MLESVLWSVGIPAVAGGLLLAGCWWILGLGRWPRVRCGLIALVLGGTAGGSFVASVGLPDWPPAQKWHGVFLMAAVLTGVGLIEAALPRREWAGRFILAVAAGVSSVWLLPLPDQSPVTVAMLIGGSALLTGLLDGARAGAVMPLGGLVAAAAVSAMALVAGSMTLSLMAGALCAMCGVVLLLGWLAGGRVAGGASGGGMTLGGVVAVIAVTAWTYDFDGVPGWAWVVSGGGFALACILEVGPLGRWEGWPAAVIRSVVVIGPPAFVVVDQFDAVQGALGG
ncbi:MAG: hypothetical protein QGG74_04180 [Phycisphaerales bacterium]|nr:hypothetical protein [Phycisphaerales bacterium]